VPLFIRARGEQLIAPVQPGAAGIHAPAVHSNVLAEVLLAIAVIVMSARAMGYLFERYLKQPAVIGEIVAGLMLGPSVLGAISPELQHFVLAPEAAPHLAIVFAMFVLMALVTTFSTTPVLQLITRGRGLSGEPEPLPKGARI
jgi:hypothetical protein